ncbi:hypothetical protein BH11ARM1_BH11ARM1_17680 [soil metagenome]
MIDNLGLSNRHKQLVQLASQGATDKEIALSLGIKVGTLRTYWDRLRRRFAAQSRSEIIAKVYQARLNHAFVGQEELLAALRVSSQFVWTAKADGCVDWCNDWFGIYGGLGRRDWEGQGCRALMRPDDLCDSGSRWKNAQKTGEAYEAQVLFRRSSDGEFLTHTLRLFPMLTPSGDIHAWLGTARELVPASQSPLRDVMRL